ncbi:hypothetical protein [Nocardioides sp. SR21]|uniref:hypothetical protein n=1 Tax=Nocardioides sp. SR21 TaxID=2919501 RepID=UPI001FA96FC9|nr:hypothetical protein [Nocardioides sp. SR21]
MSLGTVPPATRAARPGWRDPRLWVGVLLVAVSVVAGARLLAAADDTVAVWTVATDAGPGTLLTTEDLVAHRIRFADADQQAGYFTVDDELPADLRLLRGVAAGELLPRAALGTGATPTDAVELPVAVEADQVPPSVRAGSVVDVYLRDPSARSETTGPVLEEATVVDAPALDEGFGTVTGRRQLVVAVPAADATAFLAALGRIENPVLTVVRRS